MMASITIKHEMTYPYPADTVFAALADVEREPKWQPNLLRLWQETPGPVEAGTIIGRERKIMGKPTVQLSEVIVFQPPFRMEMREKPDADQQPFQVGYLLTPTGDATRLEFTMVIEGVPAIFASPVKRRLKGEITAQFAAFGQLLGG
jgi:uncharacterized protein YndB with AHSA1/START domain